MGPLAIHGGRIGDAALAYPDAPTPWIDLSTGINPWPYPAPRATDGDRARLPDPRVLSALEAQAARAFGVAAASVLATAGAEAAIRLVAALVSGRSAAIVEPTYGGHREAWLAAGTRVMAVDRRRIGAVGSEVDAVVVVNPNNPDGAALTPPALRDLARALEPTRTWLIVDEAFVETDPGLGVLPGAASPLPRLLVLRSFGKFYGLPGLRLGFVCGEPEAIADLRRRQGEWPVGADALAAGLAAYGDAAWADDMRTRLAAAARRLDALLARAGLTVVGGTSLFRLAAADDAATRFERLAQAGVLSRPFDYAPKWLRFGLPATDDWPRVEAALMESA